MIANDHDSGVYFKSRRRNGKGAARARKLGSLIERARRIETALSREAWLPFGLRTLLATEIPQVRQLLEEGRRARAEREVHRLALMSFRYGPKMLDSEAVAQLRILDLELCPQRDLRSFSEAWNDDHGEALEGYLKSR